MVPGDSVDGLDPFTSRQHLLHHVYSPLISVQASHNADQLIQTTINNLNLSVLQFLKPYGNNAKQIHPGQQFKITNCQLITKTYPSFPVRFELPLPDLLSIINASKDSGNKKGTKTNSSLNSISSSSSLSSTMDNKDPPLKQLFSPSALEFLLKHRAFDNGGSSDLYLDLFSKTITSNVIVPFDTFNHPIAQIFAINYHSDTLDDLRKFIVTFRNFNFPKYFQIDDLLMHVFVFYNPSIVNSTELTEFQNEAKMKLSISCTMIAIEPSSDDDDTKKVSYLLSETSTMEEDLQRISLEQKDIQHQFHVPESLDSIIKRKVYEFISKFLVPHMERKVRVWDDLVLSPKKLITGRFFSVSKMIFSNNSNNSSENSGNSSSSSSSASFNYQENYYHKSSQEQIIRKLADWSMILKDFKYAYSTYDLIKKDYSNDKAWLYVASVQEICVVSLLLAQTQQTQQTQAPDRNTLRKIRHDIIEPYCDNLLYTFKSRFNLKSYGIKSLIVIIELLLCMSIQYNNAWWWNDLIEKYLIKCINEFYPKLTTNGGGQVIRALLCERLGYTFSICIYSGAENSSSLLAKDVANNDNSGLYVNHNKLQMQSVQFSGLSKTRKSCVWYLLAMKEWLELKNKRQIEILLKNISIYFPVELTNEWYDREDLLLGKIKRFLQTQEVVNS